MPPRLPNPRTVLAGIWIVTLFVCEILLFRSAIWRCEWPEIDQARRNPSVPVTHIAIIADPQLSDHLSYKQKPGSLGLWLTQFTCDYYMRRNYWGVLSHLKPDAVLFLGDLFDGGREWDNATWIQELRRFASVFRLYESGKNNRQVFYVAGNHDYGFADGVVETSYNRFVEYFGEPNWAIQIAKHTLIAIDTVSLSGSADSLPKRAAENFLSGIEALRPKLSNRILFTHIPLWRPDDAGCGKLRGSRPMRQGRGHQYQNFLDKKLSAELIHKVEPDVAIFSGDDHDYCLYTHHQAQNAYTEHTIGSFSWQQGNRHPSFGMLTLFPTNLTEPDFKTAEVNVCFLPDQISIYVFYGVLFVATLAVLAVVVFLGLDSREEIKQPRSPTIGPISVEEGMRGSGSIASRGQGTGSLLSLRMRIHHLYPVYFRALGYVVLHSVAAFVIFVLWEHLY